MEKAWTCLAHRGNLEYWICEKCRRRYDLVKPIPIKDLETGNYDSYSKFACHPCGKVYSAAAILKQARETELSRLSESKKVIVKLDHIAEMLHNIQGSFVRLERAIDDLSRR